VANVADAFHGLISIAARNLLPAKECGYREAAFMAEPLRRDAGERRSPALSLPR
jgi:hypothetical protein